MYHQTPELCALFGVSRQTIVNWSKRYAAFLSDAARPPKGRHLQFDDSDLTVLALVAEMSRIRTPEADIRASLANGVRGELPSEPIGSALVETSEGTRHAVLLRAALEKSELRRIELEGRVSELQSTSDQQRGQIDLLKTQLEESRKEIRQLYEELALLKARDTD